jgi:hypothetical protein
MASIMSEVVSHFACGRQRRIVLKAKADRILANDRCSAAGDCRGAQRQAPTDLWSHQNAVVVGTVANSSLTKIGLGQDPACMLVGYDPSAQILTLRDPIGGAKQLTVDQLMQSFEEIDYNDVTPQPSSGCDCT